MNVHPNRPSHPAIYLLFIALGVGCLGGTASLSFLVKDKLADRLRTQQNIENFSSEITLNSFEQQIQAKDFQIKTAESMSDSNRSLREAEEALNKTSNIKPANAAANFEREKAARIRELKYEKAELIAYRDAHLKKKNEENARPRSWGEWFDEYNIRLLMVALPFVGLALWLIPLTFWQELPPRNPLSLTDFERRCVIFVAVAVIVSALGFMLFVWFLSITA
jgi:hypothetical protein